MAEHEQSNVDSQTIKQHNSSSIAITPENIILYWMSGQIASWKVRIALEELQLQGYRNIMIIRPDQVDRGDDFWKNNEYGMVPSLRIQDITLNGVLPALLFLETLTSTLIPETSSHLVLERTFESLHFQRISSEDLIGYFLSLDMYKTLSFDTDLREKREKILFRELIRWNDYISHQGSMSSIAHTSFTLADILFFPELALAVRFGLSLAYFPCLDMYYETLSKRSSIRKTWPYHWLHTTMQYDWLLNIDRFAKFYSKQPETTCQNKTLSNTINIDTSQNQNKDEKVDLLND